jgi:hypothetical protein
MTTNTLTVLAVVNRVFPQPMSEQQASMRREIVIGLCRDRFTSSWDHLARLTCETPESVRDLWLSWNRRPAKFRQEWQNLFK